MADHPPWRDRDALARLLADWSARHGGCDLHRVAAGAGWVDLQLAGPDRAGLFLGALPGAPLAFPYRSALPDSLRRALPPAARHPLRSLLAGARLQAAGLLADDLALQIDWEAAGGRLTLRHQLFGSRGGTTLLAADGRLLWTAHPSPHPCLSRADAPLAAPVAADPTAVDRWMLAGQRHLARRLELALGDRLHRRLHRSLAASARLVGNLAADLARSDEGHNLRLDAETLASNLHAVPRGASRITCRSPHDGAERVIGLDPALTAAANLERLFHLARKAQRGREVVAARLRAARGEQEVLQRAARELASCLHDGPPPQAHDEPASPESCRQALDRLAAVQSFADRHRDLFGDPGVPAGGKAPEEPARPFRRYLIAGRWEVWVGRNSRENDLLTHRASHLRDLWLHAQGSEGSHVVLRTGGRPEAVPRAVIERAAGLAALFSKARHSSLVPVLWTERRYVRRPRGAAPGTAVCLRAQSLFATPGVAEGVEPA